MKNTIKALATSALLLTSSVASAAKIEAEDLPLKAAWEEVEYELEFLKQETTLTECRVTTKPWKFLNTYFVTIGHGTQQRQRNIVGDIIPEIDVKVVVEFDSARAAMDFYNKYNNEALGFRNRFSPDYPLVFKGKPSSWRGSTQKGLWTRGHVVLRDYEVVSVNGKSVKPVVAAKPVEKPFAEQLLLHIAEQKKEWETKERKAKEKEDFDTWKKYPKEIKHDSWEKLVDNPVEYDYDVWDREKMKMVHLFKEEGIAIFKDDKGNYIWTNKNIQSNVKLIDKKLGLYIVTTYYMDHTGMFVKPSASPVQMSSKSEVGRAAYDKMWNDNWLSHHCLKTAYYRMLELEEELEDDSFGGRVD